MVKGPSPVGSLEAKTILPGPGRGLRVVEASGALRWYDVMQKEIKR